MEILQVLDVWASIGKLVNKRNNILYSYFPMNIWSCKVKNVKNCLLNEKALLKIYCNGSSLGSNLHSIASLNNIQKYKMHMAGVLLATKQKIILGNTVYESAQYN